MRTPRPRLVGLVLAATSVAALTGSVVGAAPPGEPAPTASTSFFWARGPSASYGSDYGGLLDVPDRRFTVPGGATSYDAVLTLGLRYRTEGRPPYSVSLTLKKAGDRRAVRTQPAELPLAGTRGRQDSRTVQFRVSGLQPGATYSVDPFVNASIDPTDRGNSIATGGLVLDVRLTPR
jgi:hypothetical protein